MPTIDGGDDAIWVGGPDEGFGVVIVLLEEAFDRGLEVDDRMEDAAFQPALGELGEETLDRIEPGARGRREMEDEPWVTRQPGHDLEVQGSSGRHPADAVDVASQACKTDELTANAEAWLEKNKPGWGDRPGNAHARWKEYRAEEQSAGRSYLKSKSFSPLFVAIIGKRKRGEKQKKNAPE